MDQSRPENGLPKGRLILGIVLVLIGQSFPLLVPVVVKSGLPSEWKTALSGLFAFGIPNIFVFSVIVMLGKDGFAAIKRTIFGWFRRQFAPPDIVGRMRYFIGLVLFFVPIIFGWLSPYLIDVLPDIHTHRVPIGIAGDIMLIVGLFVLGGDFWDKLRSLFVRKARVTFPKKGTA